MLDAVPALAKTTDAAILAATRRLLEKKGADGLTMTQVAQAVGLRAPSLYRRFRNREELLHQVELALWHALGEALRRAARAANPLESLTGQAIAYRRFAKRNPNGYALLFHRDSPRSALGRRARQQAFAAAMPAFANLVGEEQLLAAARVLTPYLHGFVSMELAGAFRFGRGLDAAFRRGVATILRGLMVHGAEGAAPLRSQHGRADFAVTGRWRSHSG
jgi:AcrR family transcriptional regulator